MWPVTAPGGGARPSVAVLTPALLLAVSARLQGPYRSLSTEICSFEPEFEPSSAECDLRWTNSLNLSSNFVVQQSLRRLRISNADRVEMQTNALLNLPAIESIHLENITTLLMASSTPKTGERQGPVTIKVNRIWYVRLETKSLASRQLLDVTISNVNRKCIIHPDAIVSSSTMTNITLKYIVGGYFFSDAFNSTLGRLSLRKVTVSEPCDRRTFAGHIRELSLKNVRFPSVNEDCFLAKNWSSLKIHSSQLGDISGRGLRGNIENVQIKQSTLGQISPDGFSLNVTSFSITKTYIHELANDALNVRARDKVYLARSNITSVRRDAFLHLVPASGARLRVILSDLTINGIRRGWLIRLLIRLTNQAISLTLKNVLIRRRCDCSTVQRTRRLLYGKPGENIRRKLDRASVLRVLQNIRCLHNDQTPSLWTYYCSSCPSPLDAICGTAARNSETDTGSRPAAVPVWALLLTLLGCLLLFGAIITLLVIDRRRQDTPRRRLSCARRPPSQRITAANIEHSLPHLSRGEPQMSEQSPGVMLHFSGGTPKADPTYEEVPASYTHEKTSAACYPMYEELPLLGQTQEDVESGLQPQPTQVQPLYATVDKNRGENGTLPREVDSNDPPLYEQINKKKPADDHQSGGAAHPTARVEMAGSDAVPTIPETPSLPGKETADPPLYAQITRKKSGQGRPGRPEEASESEPAPGCPEYNHVTTEAGASHHTLRQPTDTTPPGPADAGDAPARDRSPRRDLADASPDNTPEHSGPASVDDSSLYASVIHSTVESNGAGADDDGDGGLQYNTLYGTRMPAN